MTNDKELWSHPLLKNIIESLKPLIHDLAAKIEANPHNTGKLRIKESPNLSEKEQYNVEVMHQVSTLLDYVDRLKHTVIFIKRFPSPKTFKKQEISHYIWLEYHFSYYVITMVSIWDIVLVLINSIFRLGNPENLCKPDIIKKNKWVKTSNINKSLNCLNKIIEQYRPIRNTYIHRGKAPKLFQIFESEMLDLLDLISFVNLHSKQTNSDGLLDLIYKGEIDKICDILKTEISKLKLVLLDIFDNLLPIYENHVKNTFNENEAKI